MTKEHFYKQSKKKIKKQKWFNQHWRFCTEQNVTIWKLLWKIIEVNFFPDPSIKKIFTNEMEISNIEKEYNQMTCYPKNIMKKKMKNESFINNECIFNEWKSLKDSSA